MLDQRARFDGLHVFAPHVGQEIWADETLLERSQHLHDVNNVLCWFMEAKTPTIQYQ